MGIKKISVNSVEELWGHQGDIIKIGVYKGIINLILRIKMKGRLEIQEAWKNREYFDEQKYLVWAISSTKNRGTYIFRTLKKGTTISDIIGKGGINEKNFKKRIIPLRRIKIVTCFCNEKV